MGTWWSLLSQHHVQKAPWWHLAMSFRDTFSPHIPTRSPSVPNLWNPQWRRAVKAPGEEATATV